MMDVKKVLSILSKTFQSDELCITDVGTSLETMMTLLSELRLEKGPHYKRFIESYSEETAILKCGKKSSQVQLTRAGTSIDSQFDSLLIEVKGYLDTRFGNLQEQPLSYFRVFDPEKCHKSVQDWHHMATMKSSHWCSNLWTTLSQNTQSDLMRMSSSDCTVKDYNVKPAISNWFSGAKTKRHIL